MRQSHADQQRRVVLIVDACSDARPLVDLAVDLVAEMTADGLTHLQGLFIEDEDLLSIADLPCSQEIAQHTALPRATSRAQMQDVLLRQSSRFRHYLEQEARSSQLSWSCSNRAGQVSMLLSLVESTASCHILASHTSRHAFPGSHGKRRIVLLDNQSPLLLQVLQTAVRQFQDQRLEVMLIESGDSERHDPDAFSMVQSWRMDFPLLSVRSLAREDLPSLLADPPACDYVIIGAAEDERIQHEISRSLRCPIVLVS